MELYAVKYGEDFKYATYKTVFRGNNSEEIVPGFIFLYYIAKYNNKIIMFDTGFRNINTAVEYGVKLFDVTDEVNHITKGKVDIIFITHAHFDHTDNLDLYSNSEIMISKASYEDALNGYTDSVKQILLSDKVLVIEDEYIYNDKFRFQVIDGHTNGSSVIYFNEGDNQYVILGDEAYSCENISRNIPNGNVYNGEKNAKFISDTHHKGLIALPYHDIKIFQDYEAVSKNIVRII